MADIQTYLDYILSKVYGREVRQAIVDAINQCYADATAGITPVITTEQITGGTRFTVTVGSVSTYFDVMNGISPQVATANTASAMTDTDLIYVYTGSETGYVNGNWYYYDGTAWVSGGVYNAVAVETDTTLSIRGMPADAKAVGNAIEEIEQGGTGGTGLTSTAIALLETILRNAVYNSNQSGNITSLIAELGGSGGGDDPTPSTDDVTLEDGTLTIISTGANATLTDGVLTLG